MIGCFTRFIIEILKIIMIIMTIVIMIFFMIIMIMPPTGAPGHPGCGLAVEAAVVQSVPEEDVDLDLDKYWNGDYDVGNDGGADQCKGTTGC